MKPTTVSLRPESAQTIDDLTIKNLGGGHKILMDGGDMSFVELEFTSPGKEALQRRFFDLDQQPVIIFDVYTITIQKVSWNGESVELMVSSE